MKPCLPRRRRRAGVAIFAMAVAMLAGCVQPEPAASRDTPADRASLAAAAGPAASFPVLPGARHYPLAPGQAVTHTYQGVAVEDDFEWLEAGTAPPTRAWVAAENAYSRRYLDAMPARASLRERLNALMSSTSNSYSALVERGGTVFALKNEPPQQQPLLVALKSVDDTSGERVVYDPNVEAADGSLSIDFFRPSLDGRRVAISVSQGGSEDGTLRIVDVASGQVLQDRIPRVSYPTGGGDVAWGPASTGLYYTRYPAPGTRPEADAHFYQQVFFHQLGTPVQQDRAEVGADFPRVGETTLDSSRDGRVVTALVANGDGGDFSLYLKITAADGTGPWRRIAGEADGVKDVQIGDDGALYLLSRADAPRGKVLRLPVLQATRSVDWSRVPVVAAQSDATIEHVAVSAGALFVAELLGGPSRLRRIDLRTHRSSQVALPPVSGVDGLAAIGRQDVVAQVSTYLAPPSWLHVGGPHGPQRSALVVTSDANFNDTEVVREFATSKDGTSVPLNIIRRRGTRLDGRNPTILYGYGGYGISLTPGFSAARRAWLDRGGVYVVANLRGGGEYGAAWHLAGHLTNKQNVFDDFIAAAEFLVSRGYTSPGYLGIQGGSNGGLLMGAALTQRPDLFRAVVSSVGLYDMLRAELDPNGAFNTTEFGSVTDAAQFAALYAYSPLHRVRANVAYPAVLMLTGDNDGRVNPAHSRKMIARLQQADPGGHAILLRTSASSGHGIGTAFSERVEQATDQYGFFINELMSDTP